MDVTGSAAADAGGNRGDLRGRSTPFRLDVRIGWGYRLARAVVRVLARAWFRPRVAGADHVPATGAVVLAPVHRSFADFVFAVFVTDRKVFYMAKDTLWRSPLLGRVLVAVGAFPVHRGAADREALRRAEAVLRQGQVLVLFPEGERREGPAIGRLHEGTSFLAARTGATVVPLGIGGSDRAMPKGRALPKPLPVTVVAGPPLAPAGPPGGRRVARSEVRRGTEALQAALQEAYDQALASCGRRRRRQPTRGDHQPSP